MRFVTPTGKPTWTTLAIGLLIPAFLILTLPVLNIDLSRLESFRILAQAVATPIDASYLPTLLKLCGETLGMAWVGTVAALLFALPLSLLAGRNTSPHVAVSLVAKAVFSIVRAVPDIVWAAMLAGAVGLGVLPGVLALMVTGTAFMVKVFAESYEVVDPKPIEGVLAQGASPFAVRTFAVLPQAAPDLVGLTLYVLDVNVRAATILGLVGAGGIGYDLTQAIRLQYWDRIVLIIAAVYLMVTTIDRLSDILRSRLLR